MGTKYIEISLNDAEFGSVQEKKSGSNSRQWRGVKIHPISLALSLGACFLVGLAMHSASSSWIKTVPTDFIYSRSALFDKEGRFIIRNYDQSKTFASFLPGIAGKFGVPMWTFYVNRGQAIASFGVGNKDGPLYEYESATKAYQQTATTGFRTFMKGKVSGDSFDYQPFMPFRMEEVERDMLIGMNEVEIQEINTQLGLQTNVLYFQLPEASFPALVRQVTFTNVMGKDFQFEVLDGPVKYLPSGVSDFAIKNLPTTEEAWFKVYNLDNDQTVPFYHESASTADTDIVTKVTKGNFALSWLESGQRLPYVADPAVVFGFDSALIEARLFLDTNLDSVLNSDQTPEARTPVALSGSKFSLTKKGESVTFYSLYGTAPDLDTLQTKIVPLVTEQGYISSKRKEARTLMSDLTSPVKTSTANPIFDGYVQQNFLDNVMRGGLPIKIGTNESSSKIYHIFSRIHGDLERDYNAFFVDPTYLSQGPGNFRDVNQNRRTEVMTYPEVGDEDIRFFFSLIQADGYNPLTVAGSTWSLSKEDQAYIFEAAVDAGDAATLAAMQALFADTQLTPGKIAMFADNHNLKISREEFLEMVADRAVSYFNASYGEGYWSDHWSYNLDLITSYVSIFPDREEKLLWDSEPVKVYLSPVYVLPRHLKYILLNGQPRQVSPVVYKNPADGPKLYWPCTTWQCVAGNEASKGIPWKSLEVPLVTKVLLLAVVKFSMLDPYGMGVEMEGGKPGWLDAMNGLPSLFGSTMPEAYELYKIIQYLKDASVSYKRDVVVPTELSTLMDTIHEELSGNLAGGDDFSYWDVVRTALETYRADLTGTFQGTMETWKPSDLEDILSKMLAKMDIGFKRALDLNNDVTPTYFSWTVTDYDVLPELFNQQTTIKAKAMVPKALPMYLEGSVRRFKVLETFEEKKALYEQVASSPLRDTELNMYKICEDLKEQDVATGRIKAFARGWLENESIWLHMSYKFYLEVLRAGLYEEFWAEAQTGIVAFMDPLVYGRSPLEASSFLASSAFKDDSLHGQGFVARLSGSTAEFTSMWNLMMAGPQPFKVDENGDLSLEFAPALPDFLFDDGKISFTFLGKIPVTFHNDQGKSTWKLHLGIEKILITVAEGAEPVELPGGVIPSPYSYQIRDRQVSSIDVIFN